MDKTYQDVMIIDNKTRQPVFNARMIKNVRLEITEEETIISWFENESYNVRGKTKLNAKCSITFMTEDLKDKEIIIE